MSPDLEGSVVLALALGVDCFEANPDPASYPNSPWGNTCPARMRPPKLLKVLVDDGYLPCLAQFPVEIAIPRQKMCSTREGFSTQRSPSTVACAQGNCMAGVRCPA